MRVLWLSFTAAGASKMVDSSVAGCGWIASLEDCIKRVPGITLGVGFFNDNASFKFAGDNVQYYPIHNKIKGIAGKIKQRLSTSMYDENLEGIKAVIDDFKPDIIHLFGTESGMVDVLKLPTVPVIVHLQGLVNPYLSAWFPKGMSQYNIFFSSTIKSIFLRRGYYYEYKLFKKRAKREDEAIRAAHYFFGRTNWDRNYLELVKKDFIYYHCDEVLRPIFYQHQWKQPQQDCSFRIVTVVNPQLYKGLEIILETGRILKDLVQLNFEWHVIGLNETDELIQIIEKTTGLLFSHYNILLKGMKVNEELIYELMNANIFIHPSHIDNSPNSVCEAMLLGMPVIAGNVGGIPSLITHGKDGLLYNSYDPYELAGMIQKLITQPGKLSAIGKNARLRTSERHNYEKITSTVINAYETIIKKI